MYKIEIRQHKQKKGAVILAAWCQGRLYQGVQYNVLPSMYKDIKMLSEELRKEAAQSLESNFGFGKKWQKV